MNIAKNLRRLRRERELTQEELAKFIGVSFQSVSKWECGEGYPDITLLPALANFFETTIDALIGMDELRDDENIEKILEASWAIANEGRSAERIEMMREAVKRYPASHKLWLALASVITFISDIDEAELERNKREAVEIYERILAHCTHSEWRNMAQARLCFLYDDLGQREKAAEISGKLPGISTGSLIHANFLPIEERLKHRRINIIRLAEAIDEQIFHLHWNGEYNDLAIDERIAILHKSIALFELIYEDGEYWQLAVNISERCKWLAELYMQTDDYESALQMLEKSVPYSIMYDNQPEKAVYTSVLLRGLEFERSWYGKDYTEPWSYWMLKSLDDAQYNPIRTNPRFIAVENKLKEYANLADIHES
jgi:transcriptional regulator with XRE-family HTH domain